MSAPGLFPEEPSVVTFPTVWISEPDGHPLLQLILGTRAALKFFTRNADGFLAALPSEAVGIPPRRTCCIPRRETLAWRRAGALESGLCYSSAV